LQCALLQLDEALDLDFCSDRCVATDPGIIMNWASILD
jgi:hypothetical protein